MVESPDSFQPLNILRMTSKQDLALVRDFRYRHMDIYEASEPGFDELEAARDAAGYVFGFFAAGNSWPVPEAHLWVGI